MFFGCFIWGISEMQTEGKWIFLALALKVPMTVMGQIASQGVRITLIQAQAQFPARYKA